MSFLYLYKTEKDNLDSLYMLQDLLAFARPKFMGVTLTEDEFKAKYAAYIKSSEFKNDMKKLDFLILTKKGEDIAKFKGYDMKDLHNIYAFNWCHARKCNMVFGGISNEEASKLEKVSTILTKAKEEVRKARLEASPAVKTLQEKNPQMSIKDVKAEYFVEKLMDKVSPKFSVLPQPLDKTLIGIVPEDIEENIADTWKSKFKTVYNHRILEIDEVSEEEEQRIIAEQNKRYD